MKEPRVARRSSEIVQGMTYIDLVILNLTEWACRKFQVATGRTNVWLAVQLTNLSIILYFAWAGMYSLAGDAGSRILIALFCGGLLYVLTQTLFKVPIETYEADAYRRVAKGFRNPRRVRDALLRISFLTLSLVLGYPVFFVYVNLRLHVVLLGYLLIVLTTAVLYVLACDPLPPCPGKVREWLSARFRLPERQRQTSEAIDPSNVLSQGPSQRTNPWAESEIGRCASRGGSKNSWTTPRSRSGI